jgi:hypothetical protein
MTVMDRRCGTISFSRRRIYLLAALAAATILSKRLSPRKESQHGLVLAFALAQRKFRRAMASFPPPIPENEISHREPRRAVNPLFFPRSDLCAAKKCRILTHRQPGRFDVTTQRATRLELAAFSRENIALHRPSHLHRFRPDLTAYARVLPDRERPGGIDCALNLAVDEQFVQEFDGAFDRNSSGKRSAGLRWHERAIG